MTSFPSYGIFSIYDASYHFTKSSCNESRRAYCPLQSTICMGKISRWKCRAFMCLLWKHFFLKHGKLFSQTLYWDNQKNRPAISLSAEYILYSSPSAQQCADLSRPFVQVIDDCEKHYREMLERDIQPPQPDFSLENKIKQCKCSDYPWHILCAEDASAWYDHNLGKQQAVQTPMAQGQQPTPSKIPGANPSQARR